ncbi:MAG: MFS transporter, partial [Bacillota bacterium]|nr:MFS transporter [Bacillota bacterium]
KGESFPLSSESKLLLWLDFGFAFSTSLSGLFLSIYLWRLTESWTVNGIYHISLFVFVVIGFILGGWISKLKERLLTFRLGIFLMAFFFLAIIIFQERVATFPAFFGMLNGLAQGFYWISMLVITYDVTNNNNRLHYLGWQSGIIALAGIIGPLISGYIIEWFPNLFGYIVVFALSLAIFILIIIGSFFLKQEKFKAQAFLLPFIFKRSLKKLLWKKHFYGWFIIGIREGVTLVLPPILLYDIVQKESIVGLLAVTFGIMKIISSQTLGRLGKKEQYHSYTLLAAVGEILATLVLVYEVNYATVIIFMVGNAFFNPIIRMCYTSNMYHLMSQLPNDGKKLKTELIATRQIFLTVGRILSIIFFMMFVVDMDYNYLALIMLAASFTQIILYFIMKEKEHLASLYDRHYSG